jgi:BlaI family penicillinase repressor
MKQLPRISEAEWLVMQTLWAKSPLLSAEIVESLGAKQDWHPKTVKTLLNRLVSKKAIGFEKLGRAYLYRPLVKESECVTAASQSFLDRVFGGSLRPMLAHFVQTKKISPSEVKALRKLLDKGE